MNKGQAALETLVIVTVSLLILSVILFSGEGRLRETNRDIWNTQAKASLKTLAKGANFVYSQSTGATANVSVTIPPSVLEINVNPHYFEFIMVGGQGSNNSLQQPTIARLNGSLNSVPGTKFVTLKNEGDYIRVASY